jgi:hypothetical protein
MCTRNAGQTRPQEPGIIKLPEKDELDLLHKLPQPSKKFDALDAMNVP